MAVSPTAVLCRINLGIMVGLLDMYIYMNNVWWIAPSQKYIVPNTCNQSATLNLLLKEAIAGFNRLGFEPFAADFAARPELVRPTHRAAPVPTISLLPLSYWSIEQ